MNDIFGDANKPKQFTKYDVPKIRNMCIVIYGSYWWANVDLNELFEQLPLIQKEYNQIKVRDEIQKSIAKVLGVKFKK